MEASYAQSFIGIVLLAAAAARLASRFSKMPCAWSRPGTLGTTRTCPCCSRRRSGAAIAAGYWFPWERCGDWLAAFRRCEMSLMARNCLDDERAARRLCGVKRPRVP